MKRIELLSPAKTAEIGRQAILHGADAVYIGGPAFGARDKASNDLRDIAALVEFAQRFHARIYVTLNTILADAELEPARRVAQQCWNAGVDALIVQDMGLLELDLPPIDLHASTQCDIRTPEKARFLADCGFSQLVLARELSLSEIAAVRAALPAEVIVEHFIHGALCVAFSGLCYISHAQTGRSANRGDCSQACRLPYTLQDNQGRVVAFEKHLLSVKDNNQSANLLPLIKAGVQSFKIEGRYKDAGYVKNITGHYRQLLDVIFEQHPELAPASSGKVTLKFAPNPDKTFHRGATDYFTHGRSADPKHIAAFDTPAFVGLPVGKVTEVAADSFTIATQESLANGDGISWLHKRQAIGTQANRVERLNAGQWRIWPNDPVGQLAGLHPGLYINRNRDQAWEQSLTKDSAERRIPVDALLTETAEGFALTLTDSDGLAASATAAIEKQPAKQPEQAATLLEQQLRRLGSTDFLLRDCRIDWTQPWFIPNSATNALRRDAIAALEAVRRSAHVRLQRRPAVEPPSVYPEAALSFLANVYNSAARRFYAKHGVQLIAAAYEAHQEKGDVPLMITKHCLRHAFNLCPHQAKGITGVQGQVRAEPMTLVNGNERLTLTFDCRACEMHVVGRIKPHILASPPPG
ncbi:MAG: U32 family peptidase [Rhodocyclaceae bacterium]|nr:U32 family peptidase [Rhodocyclaceae bacterium]MDZ4215835.1 U32 family peptidase [Rhodocyclaceae bacterium]